jgi:serine phosphatase RsbU (regulator of sigma subunit)
MNRRGDEFGSDRLKQVVSRTRDLSAKEIVNAIVTAVDEHRAGFAPNDDTTVVVLKFTLPTTH